MDAKPIVVEQTFNAPVTVVWQAITDKQQMQQWFFETITEFTPEVGFETEFNVPCEGKNYLHMWKVTEVVPQLRLVYQWRYGGYPGDSAVSWELSEEEGITKLTFTHTGHETIQGDDIFSRENGVAGWRYFIQESLKAFLQPKNS
ncbi:SRPBCC domain-containing protein [Thalassomonas viridans]|uniref:SRPBCC domain-containing protein n=1 Tax=Thalassomonas viridans TaxID=137584 RepID=A0AAE9ZA69_9GAMM|nr:SRPBCC domain-containing protein [Thalassomonas viridans]